MRTQHYARTVNAAKLMDELVAAIPALAPVVIGGYPTSPLTVAHGPSACDVTVPDEVEQATVDAVVAAHDPAPSADQLQQQQRDTADTDALTQFAGNYAAMLTKLDDIQAEMDAIAARADTLSTIAVSGTLAQTQAQLQTVLRRLGLDLGIQSRDFSAVALGLQRELRALAVLKRRIAGGAP